MISSLSRVVAGLAVTTLATGTAFAFPLLDPTNRDSVATITGTGGGAPVGTDLPATDTKGLKGQLDLVNPRPAGNPSGWTITPSLTLQEMFTDNAYEVKAPRRFDAITVLTPGIAVQADTARVNLNLLYTPSLYLHAINGPLNALTQQLNMTGLVTVVPDLAFVDVRALSGVQSRFAGLAGGGTLGGGVGALAPASAAGAGLGIVGTGIGNRQNLVQTSSFGISPYLLRQFGDYGTGKLGFSFDASRSANLNGFGLSPFPAGGTNGQSGYTTEEIASFNTGEYLGRVQATFGVDLSQTNSRFDGGAAVVNNSAVVLPQNTFSSRRELYNVQLSYALNRTFTLLGMIGYQSVHYSQTNGPSFNGLTWEVGVTATPDPDTTATVKYGHINGTDSFTANARYALTGRTMIALDYTNSLGTQLEHLQSQFNGSVVDSTGRVVNLQNGGNQFLATNGLGVRNGVFRYNTLNLTATTAWLRDTLQASLTWTTQTSVSSGGSQLVLLSDPSISPPVFTTLPAGSQGQATDIKAIALTWTHELSPDLTLSTSAAYSFIHRNGSLGNDSSLSTAVGVQYALSDNSSLSARYSFFDRISRLPGYSMYENLFIVGFTRKF